MNPTPEDIAYFKARLDEYRYDFVKLAYLIFPFGQKGTELEHFAPYDWQVEEWLKLGRHLSNPKTRYQTYRLIVSSGNGAAKTAFGAMTVIILLYTQHLKGRITANTAPQLSTVVWPEYDVWFRRARFHELFFEKFGTSIKAKNAKLASTWRFDAVTWDESNPTGISGLHNFGRAIIYVFEEAPGIPAVIWNYTKGAFTERNTIKLFFAFGNSDDPESKFEQNMVSPLWHSRRIDTRTLKHIDPLEIADWLNEAGGDDDHDDFRTRVRGLPRKSAKDSIISLNLVEQGLERAKGFDKEQVSALPVVLSCDPAWTGGDETTIWYQQGHYRCLLEKYKLDKANREDHMITYNRLCYWEHELRADAVVIDQAEGTAVYTLANNAGKTSWYLISFANSPTDTPEFKDSEFANIRAQMYYQTRDFLQGGGILDTRDPEWIESIKKQLCWTKGTRHKVNQKKLAEAKLDIKKRVGQSPDVADGCVLLSSVQVMERLPENMREGGDDHLMTGQTAYKMPSHPDPYETMDADFEKLYD